MHRCVRACVRPFVTHRPLARGGSRPTEVDQRSGSDRSYIGTHLMCPVTRSDRRRHFTSLTLRTRCPDDLPGPAHVVPHLRDFTRHSKLRSQSDCDVPLHRVIVVDRSGVHSVVPSTLDLSHPLSHRRRTLGSLTTVQLHPSAGTSCRLGVSGGR